MVPRFLIPMIACFAVGIVVAFSTGIAGNSEPQGLGKSRTGTIGGTQPYNSQARNSQAQNSQTREAESNDFSLLETFSRMAPKKASWFILLRPNRILESDVDILADAVQQTSPLLEEAKQVDFLIFAASTESFYQVINHRSQSAFQEVADLLAADPPRKKKLQPTLINHLNKDSAVLIRFKKPTNWKYFKSVFRSEKDFRGQFSVSESSGLQWLECNAENCCVVVKLDERTFVTASKQQLIEGLKATSASNDFVAGSVDSLKQTSFQGEAFLARKFPPGSLGLGVFADSWEVVNRINQAQVKLDFKGATMLDLAVQFPEADSAKEFKSFVADYAQSTLAGMESLEINMSGSTTGDQTPQEEFFAWTNNRKIDLMKSLNVRRDDSTVSILVPRPANLDSVIKKYAKLPKRATNSFKRQQREPTPVKMAKVVVAAKDLDLGKTISADDLNAEHWPQQLVPENAVVEESSVLDRKVRQYIPRGMPLLKSNF